MNLVLAVTGATGAHGAQRLMRASSWPVSLVMSQWGQRVFEEECGSPAPLRELAETVYEDDNLGAPLASGSVPTAGMVILPCSANTLAAIANGFADTLIHRAAQCHLKERRPLVLCIRETPWSLPMIENARAAALAGAIIMPISPPYYQFKDEAPEAVSLTMLMDSYVERVLSVLGQPVTNPWGSDS